MKRIALAAAVVVLFAPPAVRADDDKVDVKALEKAIDAALKAYNEDDHKAFWGEFSKTVDGLKSKETFDALYKNGYKATFGKLVKRGDLMAEKSVLTGEVGLARYVAEFEKDKKVEVNVNWIKDGKDVKLMQVQISKPQ